MRANFHRRKDVPGPMKIDLALSRVRLAALRMKRELPKGPDAQKSAETLYHVFLRSIDRLKGPQEIEPDVVPVDPMRQVLQQTLPKLVPSRRELRVRDPKPLQDALPLLEDLSTTGQLSADKAEILLAALAAILKSEETPPQLPQIKAKLGS